MQSYSQMKLAVQPVIIGYEVWIKNSISRNIIVAEIAKSLSRAHDHDPNKMRQGGIIPQCLVVLS